MERQFLAATECRENGNRHQAARATVEIRSCPKCSPRHLSDELLKVGVEISLSRQRPIDVGIPQYLPAHPHPEVVPRFAHGRCSDVVTASQAANGSPT